MTSILATIMVMRRCNATWGRGGLFEKLFQGQSIKQVKTTEWSCPLVMHTRNSIAPFIYNKKIEYGSDNRFGYIVTNSEQ